MLIERKEFKDDDGSLGYVEALFNSGNVLKTTYFPKKKLLYIAFSRGDTYSYQNITDDVYREFESSDSQGSFFYKNFNKNNKYPTRREFSLYPNEVRDLKQIVEENSNNDE